MGAIDSKAGNQQCEQNVNIGDNPGNYYSSPLPGTCNNEFSKENKCTYVDTRPTMNQEAGGEKSDKLVGEGS